MEIPCLGLPAAEREGREERGGEKSVGEGKGGVSLALSAITVSGGGRGHGKGEPSRPGPARFIHSGGGATRLAKRTPITDNPIVGSQRVVHLLSNKSTGVKYYLQIICIVCFNHLGKPHVVPEG